MKANMDIMNLTMDMKLKHEIGANGDSNHVSPMLGNQSLGSQILRAVDAIDLSQLQPVAAANAGMAFEPRTLLGLLTYCYAVGILDSHEVERTLAGDQLFRLVCHNEFPSWHVIRRFRRCNRQALHKSLENAWKAAHRAARTMESRVIAKQEPAPPPNPQANCSPSSDTEIDDAVDNLLEQAVWLDSMALED